MAHFGSRIKEIRIKRMLSQNDLAKAFYELDFKKKINRTAIAQWETGATKAIEGDNLLRVSTILGVSPFWLLYGDGKNWYNNSKQGKE